jgi:hypothetical protein
MPSFQERFRYSACWQSLRRNGLLFHMASDYRGRRVGDIVVVHLTHKFAEMIDGIDLTSTVCAIRPRF